MHVFREIVIPASNARPRSPPPMPRGGLSIVSPCIFTHILTFPSRRRGREATPRLWTVPRTWRGVKVEEILITDKVISLNVHTQNSLLQLLAYHNSFGHGDAVAVKLLEICAFCPQIHTSWILRRETVEYVPHFLISISFSFAANARRHLSLHPPVHIETI